MKQFRAIVSILMTIVLLFSAQSFSLLAYAEETENTVYYLGDVNKNGSITAMDARLTLMFAAGLKTPSAEEYYYADYIDDGRLSAMDARMILKAAAGSTPLLLPTEKPKQPPKDMPTQEELKQKWISSFSDKVSYSDLEDNLKWLVNDIGIRNWWNSSQNKAGDLLYNRLISYGFNSSTCKKIDFKHGDVVGRNIMATIPTSKSNADIILIVTHYDTVSNTSGAVDNSSGVTTLLQLAKIFKQTQDDYGVELRFLFTAGEEQGYYGAKNYVNSLTATEKARHKMVYNMDMTAKPNKSYDPNGKYCIAISTEPMSNSQYTAPAAKPNIGTKAVDEAKTSLGNLGEYAYYSAVRAGHNDLMPFRKAGMTAMSFSWRVIDSSRSNGADKNLATPKLIHTTADTFKNCDVMSLYNSTVLITNSVARLLVPYHGEF
ncbi:MAG: M28 family peptidase [Clostridia bacterium]|nr:M28 family peptidase [Clostridia bacterium]